MGIYCLSLLYVSGGSIPRIISALAVFLGYLCIADTASTGSISAGSTYGSTAHTASTRYMPNTLTILPENVHKRFQGWELE